jgi:hypothetical protein
VSGFGEPVDESDHERDEPNSRTTEGHKDKAAERPRNVLLKTNTDDETKAAIAHREIEVIVDVHLKVGGRRVLIFVVLRVPASGARRAIKFSW